MVGSGAACGGEGSQGGREEGKKEGLEYDCARGVGGATAAAASGRQDHIIGGGGGGGVHCHMC